MKNEQKNKRHNIISNKGNRNSHLKNAFYHTRPESVSDCTGYTPVIPLSEEESESYEDLMDIPAPERYYHRYNED